MAVTGRKAIIRAFVWLWQSGCLAFQEWRLRLVPNKYSIAAALLLQAGGSYAAPPVELPAAMLDWQVYEQRPAGQVCQGFYQPPMLDLPEQHIPLEDASLFAEASQLSYSPDGGLLLEDAVQLRKGGLFVTADQARVNADRTQASLTGHLAVRQENLLLRGAAGEYQLETSQLQLSEAHYVIHQQQLRGSAWQLEQLEDGRVILRDASLTSCAPGDQAWRLVAGRLNLNRDSGFGDAYNVRMEIQRVPVFYWPWFRFPIDDQRHTGLLAPYLSWSKNKGLDYRQPFYWNIAPNYDATFFPRYIEQRGTQLGAEFRYLQPSDSGELYYSQLSGDALYHQLDRWHFAAQHQGYLSSPSRLSYSLDFSQVSDDRYFENLGDFNLKGSDTELQQRLSLQNQTGIWNTQLNFSGYHVLHPNSDPNLSLNSDWQSTYHLFDLRSGRRAAQQNYYYLPQLLLTGSDRLTDHWSWSLTSEVTEFDKLYDSDLGGYYTGAPVLKPGSSDAYYIRSWGAPKARRLHLEPRLAGSWSWPWAFVRPQAKLRHSQYWLNPEWDPAVSEAARQGTELQPSTTVPVFSLDTGVFLERDASLLGHNLIQTLEPRVFAAYVPYVEQYQVPNFFDGAFVEPANQFFQAERTTGRDRTGDVKKLTLGLTQRLISRDTGREWVSFGLAKELYLADRILDGGYLHPDEPSHASNQPREDRAYNLVRDESSLLMQVNWQLSEHIQLRSSLLWDDYFQKTDQATNSINYSKTDGLQLSMGHVYTSNFVTGAFKGPRPDKDLLDDYSYLKQAEEQVYAAMVLPINAHWRLFAKQTHDLKRNEKLESLTGFEYNSCCWQVQFLYRDWVDNPDTSPAYNTSTGFEDRERDYGYFLQVVFKGLGGVGQGTSDLLSEEIQGYTDR